MPKDISKRGAGYKIVDREVNEFEFQQNQQDIAEQQKGGEEHLIPGTPPEQTVAEVFENAQKVVAKRSKAASAKLSGKTAAKRKVASKTKTTRKQTVTKKTVTNKKTASKKKAVATKTRRASKKASATKKASAKKTRKTASKK